jgi:F420-0:gamma-glutamyl ligase
MPDTPNRPLGELAVNAKNLYREEVFTDLEVATLRRLTPVKEDGSDDPSRPVLFVGATQLMTQVGALPVSAEIEAKDLREAIAKFPEKIAESVQRMMEEAREMQRREASRVVVASPGTQIPPGGKGLISLR